MNILDQIIDAKKKEVASKKALTPVQKLEQSIYFETQPVSLVKYIRRPDKIGLIAEIKRKSPSKGIIHANAQVERISIGYMQAGASGLSVLTDQEFFGGTNEDLITARNFNFCPVLRKDFIIDEYQIIEAKSIGADVILLIAAVLKPEEVKRLSSFAQSLGMEVLLEVHNWEEMDQALTDTVNLVGVNNRDLTTFKTDVDTSRQLAELIPNNFLKVSESGISNPLVVLELMNYGYEGFLIGEHFMQHGKPERAALEFVKQVKKGMRKEAI